MALGILWFFSVRMLRVYLLLHLMRNVERLNLSSKFFFLHQSLEGPLRWLFLYKLNFWRNPSITAWSGAKKGVAFNWDFCVFFAYNKSSYEKLWWWDTIVFCLKIRHSRGLCSGCELVRKSWDFWNHSKHTEFGRQVKSSKPVKSF